MDSATNMQHVSLSITVTALGFQTKKEIGNSKQQTHYDKLITIRWFVGLKYIKEEDIEIGRILLLWALLKQAKKFVQISEIF